MKRIVVAITVAGLAVVLLAPVQAHVGASRVIDRTFSCEAGFLGGVHQAEVESYWSVPPQAERRIASATVTTNLTNGFLGGISSSSMYVNRLYCKATSAKVRLTTTALAGGPFSQFSTEYQCFTSRRILLRIRTEFVKPTTLRSASPSGFPQLQALGATTQAELAVATVGGKPIAYAWIAGPKKARLFTSPDCQED
jgi:hypothetical protein